MTGYAPQYETVSTNEVRNVAIDFADVLDSGELLTGTPTVTGDASLTITNEQVNTSLLTINGESVAVGAGVQFRVSPSTAGVYTITVRCGTDASQTVEGKVRLRVE